jgi:hypothetical protein
VASFIQYPVLVENIQKQRAPYDKLYPPQRNLFQSDDENPSIIYFSIKIVYIARKTSQYIVVLADVYKYF